MTADSINEQGSVGLDRLNDAEYARFQRLNDAYQDKFGIPFIVCVRRHTKDSILNEFERRLAQDKDDAIETALGEIFRIAALRLDSKRHRAGARCRCMAGCRRMCSTPMAACPARNVPIELWELSRDGDDRLLVRTVTNQDGRTDQPLIGGRPVPIGTYELRFTIAAYFKARGVALAEPPFLDIVPIRFSVAEPEAHYHVPLVMTPWAYSTYRGS